MKSPLTRRWAIASLVASMVCIAHGAAIGWYGALSWFFMGALVGWIAWLVPAGVTTTFATLTFVRGRWKWMALLALILAPIGSFSSCWAALVARGECENEGHFSVIECHPTPKADPCTCPHPHQCVDKCSDPQLVYEGCCACPTGSLDWATDCHDAGAPKND